jgi:ABC-type transporter Mla subunit MlaD
MTRPTCLLAIALALLTGCGKQKSTMPRPLPEITFGIVFADLPNGFHTPAPVRIAGVRVGRATGVEPQGLNMVVRVAVVRSPRFTLYGDATAKLRPQIFKRGEWFVDLFPGSKREPVLTDGNQIAGLKSP